MIWCRGQKPQLLNLENLIFYSKYKFFDLSYVIIEVVLERWYGLCLLKQMIVSNYHSMTVLWILRNVKEKRWKNLGQRFFLMKSFLQYALHTTSFSEQPISDKTLSRFRKRCYDYETLHGVDLYRDCVKDLGSKIAKIMKLNGRIRRMDSMMIESNIRFLSRMKLIYTCIPNWLFTSQRNILTKFLNNWNIMQIRMIITISFIIREMMTWNRLFKCCYQTSTVCWNYANQTLKK